MQKLLTYSLISLFSCLAGIHSCLLYISNFKVTLPTSISYETNPLDIISVLITIILAVYVTRVLTKKNEKEKDGKLLFIESVKRFNADLNSRIDFILKLDDFDTVQTKSSMKILRKKLASLLDIANKFSFISAEDSLNTDLRSNLTDIWELLTDTPRKDVRSKSPVHVKKEVEIIRLEKINKIEVKLIEISELTFHLIMKIE